MWKAIERASSHRKYSFDLTLVDYFMMHFVINLNESINVKNKKTILRKLYVTFLRN